MGDGNYSLDVTSFTGAGDGLQVEIPSSTNIQVVFCTQTLANSGVAVTQGTEMANVVGQNIANNRPGLLEIAYGGISGVCAIIVEGKLYARIALHNSSFSVEDCFALPLPLFAYVEGQNIEPISIADNSAGWGLFGNQARVRITGYNLPTNLKYRAGSESVLQDMTADGGDYGIEFTQPDLATFIMILNGTYWLFLDRR